MQNNIFTQYKSVRTTAKISHKQRAPQTMQKTYRFFM